MIATDVLSKIEQHQISGVMLHKNMMTAYDFLGLRSFKRLHEYRMFCELEEADRTMRYAINHYNRILPDGHPTAPFVVPADWVNVDRMSITNENRRKYLKIMMEKWVAWERNTKDAMQKLYKELLDAGEIATAKKVLRLVCDSDHELKNAERLYIKLVENEFDLKCVSVFEKEMHDHYKKKKKRW